MKIMFTCFILYVFFRSLKGKVAASSKFQLGYSLRLKMMLGAGVSGAFRRRKTRDMTVSTSATSGKPHPKCPNRMPQNSAFADRGFGGSSPPPPLCSMAATLPGLPRAFALEDFHRKWYGNAHIPPLNALRLNAQFWDEILNR